MEAGAPREFTTIIRPGVDFAAIRAARERTPRDGLGLPSSGRIYLTISPPSRAAGHFAAAWAMAILHQLSPESRLIIPGCSREQLRLARLREQIYCPEILELTEDRHAIAELLAISDMLVVPASGDVPTGWLAWAMAASVPIVATAVPAIAELIADRHNGFLCRSCEPHAVAARICRAWESPDLVRQCTETARGQGYDVFRAQASLAQYEQLFDNLAGGLEPSTNLQDTATDG